MQLGRTAELEVRTWNKEKFTKEKQCCSCLEFCTWWESGDDERIPKVLFNCILWCGTVLSVVIERHFFIFHLLPCSCSAEKKVGRLHLFLK